MRNDGSKAVWDVWCGLKCVLWDVWCGLKCVPWDSVMCNLYLNVMCMVWCQGWARCRMVRRDVVI